MQYGSASIRPCAYRFPRNNARPNFTHQIPSFTGRGLGEAFWRESLPASLGTRNHASRHRSPFHVFTFSLFHAAYTPPMDLEIDDVRLSLDVTGVGDPILFIHGFPISREMWRYAANALSDRWTSINPDLRGHGESDISTEVT